AGHAGGRRPVRAHAAARDGASRRSALPRSARRPARQKRQTHAQGQRLGSARAVVDAGRGAGSVRPLNDTARTDAHTLYRVRLATWNVNSIRARVDRVTGWLERADVDVLAMQETKCADDQFPTMPFAAIGYEVVHCGFNQWNGVAIASRVGLDDVQVGFDGQPVWSDKPDVAAGAEARALRATCAGVRVWSSYIPNGRIPDSPHYRYKLEWLAALKDTARNWLTND